MPGCSFFLTNEEPGKVATSIESAKYENNTPETAAKRRICFLLLNPFYSYFYALKHGYVSPDMWEKFTKSLRPLLKDEFLYGLTQSDVFVERFALCCRLLKKGKSYPPKHEELTQSDLADPT
jgi:hypothetical protein